MLFRVLIFTETVKFERYIFLNIDFFIIEQLENCDDYIGADS